MIKIYKTNENNKVETINEIVPNSWIELVHPTKEEIAKVVDITKVDEDLVTKVLDEEELPRVEMGKNGVLIVIDTPIYIENNHKYKYETYPLGLITVNEYFITVSLEDIHLFEDFKNNKVKSFYTEKKTRFTIQILLKIASLYLKYLKIINADIQSKEKALQKSTQNKELNGLLMIEKTLVYFLTSLKANDIVLDKLSKGNVLALYDEDKELLEDAIIETKQSIEMSNIYREILTSTSDTYATIISNNLNTVMKFLAGITIVFSIPTMIASFLGMNVPLGVMSENNFAFLGVIIVSLIVSIIVAIILKKKDML